MSLLSLPQYVEISYRFQDKTQTYTKTVPQSEHGAFGFLPEQITVLPTQAEREDNGPLVPSSSLICKCSDNAQLELHPTDFLSWFFTHIKEYRFGSPVITLIVLQFQDSFRCIVFYCFQESTTMLTKHFAFANFVVPHILRDKIHRNSIPHISLNDGLTLAD